MTAAPSPEPADARDDPSGPRRRELSAPSARSLLLTILGEFVLPRAGRRSGPPRSSLPSTSSGSRRRPLARPWPEPPRKGLIEPVRAGRRTQWLLTDAGAALLEDGARRIYGFMREQRHWDGRWLVLAVTVPETQRAAPASAAVAADLGRAWAPRPRACGWCRAPTGRTRWPGSSTDLGIAGSAMSWVGESGGDRPRRAGGRGRLDLPGRRRAGVPGIRRRASTGAGSPAARTPSSPRWSWSRPGAGFPFLDPALPAELLDHDWPGPARRGRLPPAPRALAPPGPGALGRALRGATRLSRAPARDQALSCCQNRT